MTTIATIPPARPSARASSPAALPAPIARVLQVARGEVGVQEVPRGSNRGPRIRKYLAAVGLPEGYAWCAAFGAWCGLQAAKDGMAGFDHWPLPLTADCDVLLFKARKLGIVRDKPKPGDLFLVMASKNDAVHCGLVRGVNRDGSIQTIEGNSNEGGSREGYMVCERPSRSVHNLIFVRWIDVVSSVSSFTKPWKVLLRSKEGQTKTIYEDAFLQEGDSYIPVRAFLRALGFNLATLKWNAETQGCSFNNEPLPVQCLFKGDGMAWGKLRQLAAYVGLSIEVDNAAKTATLFSPDPAHNVVVADPASA